MRVATASRKARSCDDSDQRAARSRCSRSSQPLDGVDVQVVGGLVEQQHVGRAPPAPAPAPRACWCRRRARRSRASASRCRRCSVIVDALLPGPAVQRLELGLQRVEVARAARAPRSARAARVPSATPCGHRVEHGGAGLEHAAPARRRSRRSPCCVCSRPSSGFSSPARIFSSDDLPVPLRPISADALAGFEREIGAVEQRHVAIGKVGVGQREQGHAPDCPAARASGVLDRLIGKTANRHGLAAGSVSATDSCSRSMLREVGRPSSSVSTRLQPTPESAGSSTPGSLSR